MIDKETSLKLALLSFISAVLVVCIHVPVTQEAGFSMFFETLFGSKIPSIAVPFFFVASGYLLATRMGMQGYYVQLKKRVRSLLVPYFFWCLVFGLQGNLNPLLANIANHYPLMRHIDLNPIYIFGLDITRNPPLPLWFLRALILYVLAAPVLLLVTKRNCFFAFVVGLVAFNCTMKFFVPQRLTTLFCFTLAPVNILAFMCGMRFSCHPVKISSWLGRWFLFAGIGLFACLSLLASSGVKLSYPVSAFLSMSAIAMSLVGTWGVCPVIELPGLIRGRSFPIYILHAAFVPYVLLVSQKFKFMLTWPGFIANVCALIAGSLLMSWILHKYLPRFSKIVFGGR